MLSADTLRPHSLVGPSAWQINVGLLALGNVINALADEERLSKGKQVGSTFISIPIFSVFVYATYAWICTSVHEPLTTSTQASGGTGLLHGLHPLHVFVALARCTCPTVSPS